MANPVAGKGGTVFIGSVPVFHVNSWNLDIDTNMLDVTSFTTSAVVWRSFAAGLNNVTGSVSGFWNIQAGSTAQKDMQDNIFTPTTATLVLETDQTAGGKYSFGSFLSRQSVSVDIDGTADISWDLQGTGAVTYTTTT